MKTDYFSRKLPRKPAENRNLLLTILAFLAGCATYVLLKPEFPLSAEKALSVANLVIRIFGCIFLLIFLQLSAFSIIGSVIVPITDWFAGLFFEMSLATIIPFSDLSIALILKTAALCFAIIFLTVFLSYGALASAKRLFNKVKNDRGLSVDFVKTLVLAALLVILSIIGISDINMIL